MIRVSAFPTVEWLRNRACDRHPATSNVGRRLRLLSPSARFASRLKEVVSPQVVVDQGVWISTPEGEVEVPIVLKQGAKRIAICFSDRYGTDSAPTDSLLLVYGRFDGLYRVDCDQSVQAMHDAMYALMGDRALWFSNFGRLSIGRLVSDTALLESTFVEPHQTTLLETDLVKVTRMRMCKANDWVALFERALDVNIQFQTSAQ